jgi:hypothetical protein
MDRNTEIKRNRVNILLVNLGFGLNFDPPNPNKFNDYIEFYQRRFFEGKGNS